MAPGAQPSRPALRVADGRPGMIAATGTLPTAGPQPADPHPAPPPDPGPIEPVAPIEVPEPGVVDVPEPGVVDVPERGV